MQEIATTPAVLDEARAALPSLRAVAESVAGKEGVMAVISRRFVTYPQPQRTPEEWDAWWADYFDTCADIALASLEAGMRAHVADPASEFMPKPGRLRELSFTAPCRSLTRYYRAKRAVQIADEPSQTEVAKVDPSLVRQMAEDAIRKLKATSEARKVGTRVVMGSIAGKADESGITPEMREALARRQELST